MSDSTGSSRVLTRFKLSRSELALLLSLLSRVLASRRVAFVRRYRTVALRYDNVPASLAYLSLFQLFHLSVEPATEQRLELQL